MVSGSLQEVVNLFQRSVTAILAGTLAVVVESVIEIELGLVQNSSKFRFFSGIKSEMNQKYF